MLEGLAVALSNIDPVIALIKASANVQEAREKLISTPWRSESVEGMLARAGKDAARPEGLEDIYGFKDDGFYSS